MPGLYLNFNPDELFALGWMSLRRRLIALAITLIGLATFVVPLVQSDSEVLGRTHWSPLEVVLAVRAGTLPGDHQLTRPEIVYRSIDLIFGLGSVYLLLSLAVLAIWVFPSARFIGTCSVIGVAVTLGEWRFRYNDFQESIYGPVSAYTSGHHVHAGILCSVLLGVQFLLGYIAATKELD